VSPRGHGIAFAALVLASFGTVCRAGDREESLVSGGRRRTFLLHAPPGGPARRPLVLALHGRLGDGRGMERLAGLARLADQEGFLLACPDGVGRSWADGRGATPADREGIDDVSFLAALIDDAVSRFGAEPARVYAVGMSNGGFMVQRLACERASKVAAVGVVVATMSAALPESCRPSRPVPVAFLLGTEDPLVPFRGGKTPRGALLSADATLAWWAERDGCPAVPAVTTLPDRDPGDGTRVTLRVHGPCGAGAEVRAWVVEGGGHTWPGGIQYLPRALVGRTSRDLDASRELWEFLRRFAVPPARPGVGLR